MDAIFVDVYGNKKNFLYQYDIGQRLEIKNFEYPLVQKVQFQIKSLKTALSAPLTLEKGVLSVNIPNIILTYGEDIIVYFYIEDDVSGCVVESMLIDVLPRKIPANYNYERENWLRAINGVVFTDNDGFADVFKWNDENKSNQDRVGYFVNVNSSTTISKATSPDNTYGVTVNPTGFATGCNEDMLDNSGKLLPQYAYVRSFGFATVRDDGTCVVGDKCISNSSGIATKSTDGTGFKVLDRVDNNHIFIFVDNGAENIINAATQAALDKKADLVNGVLSSTQLPLHANTHKTGGNDPLTPEMIGAAKSSHTHTKQDVGLGNVDNTSDINKPISKATQDALDTKLTLVDGKIPSELLPPSSADNVVVQNIEDRDALTPFSGLLVHVKTDSTNELQPSDYLYDGSQWLSIGSVSKEEFETLKESVANLNSAFVMEDMTTGDLYTIGVNNGKLLLAPVGDILGPIMNCDSKAY